MIDKLRPILITGSHRSGTTWVGRILAEGEGVEYIHEPFNALENIDEGMHLPQFQYWFTYVTDENQGEFGDALGALLESNQSKRVLIKDPIAVFSAEWLAAAFGMDVVVLVRHPLAFVSSLKINNMWPPFTDLLQQPFLMRDYLEPFRVEMEKVAGQKQDIVGQAALLWVIINTVVKQYRDRHPDWVFLRYEDLAASPLAQFSALFERVGLEFNETLRESVLLHSRLKKNASRESNPKVTRESSKHLEVWKERLSEDEIKRVRCQVALLAQEFYPEEDWTS